MLRILAVVVLGIALGIGSALGAIAYVGHNGAVAVGPWRTPIDAGGPGRGAYLRAAAALGATLALSRQEAMYFLATTDSGGDALRGDCTYRVHGAALPARWWSITLYGADHALIATPEGRSAVASVNAAPQLDGGFSLTVSPRHHDGDWLDTANTPGLVLLARLYQPEKAAAAAPHSIALPAIERTGCP